MTLKLDLPSVVRSRISSSYSNFTLNLDDVASTNPPARVSENILEMSDFANFGRKNFIQHVPISDNDRH